MRKSVILLLLVAVSLMSGCGSEKSAKEKFVASVFELEGEVNCRESAKAPFKTAEKEDKLFNGSMVRTGRDGKAALKFVDASKVMVFPDSFFEIRVGKTLGMQKQGKAIYNVQKQEVEIEVQTDHGVTAVLGTRFMIEVASDSFSLLVDEGRVRFTRKLDGALIELGAGEKVAFTAEPGKELAKLETIKVDPVSRQKLFGGDSKLYLNY